MLEHAHICVLNCEPIRSEALKNSVLGIIASFVVDDASKVYAFDLGTTISVCCFSSITFLPLFEYVQSIFVARCLKLGA
jgi:hypothetical protein